MLIVLPFIVNFLIIGINSFPITAQNSQDISVTISQIDKSNFPQVDVYVSLVDISGLPVQAIPASSISVFENNTAITKFDLESNQTPISSLLVLDRSGSMAEAGKLKGAQDAAVAFINSFGVDDPGGLIVFNSQVNVLQDLTTDHNALISQVYGISPDGNTAFYDALWIALERANSISGRKSIIALTDGLDNQSAHNVDEVIEFARKANIPIYTIGLGNRIETQSSGAGLDEGLLTKIAQASGGYYTFSPSATELTALYTTLSAQIQAEYKISYLSPNPNKDGSNRDIKVTVIWNGRNLESSQRYNPGGIIPAVETKPESHWDLFALALLALLFLLAVPGLIDKARFALTAPGTTVSGTLSHTTLTKVSSTPPKIKLSPVSSLDSITSDVSSESASLVPLEAEVEPTDAPVPPQPRIRLKELLPSISDEEDPGISPSSETKTESLRSRIRLGETITSELEGAVGPSSPEFEKTSVVKSNVGMEDENVERRGTEADQDEEGRYKQNTEAPSASQIPRIKLYEPPSEDTSSSENDNSD